MPYPRKPDEEKHCQYCGKQMRRQRFNGALEDRGAFHRRKYCNRTCMGLAHLKEDATKSALLKRSLVMRGTLCQRCGATSNLGVHHLNGDEADNSPSNVMTLCAACHTRWHWEHGKASVKRSNFSCTVCGKPARKLGMCQKHYQRFRKYGNPLLTKKKIGSQYVLVQETPSTENGPELRVSQQASRTE